MTQQLIGTLIGRTLSLMALGLVAIGLSQIAFSQEDEATQVRQIPSSQGEVLLSFAPVVKNVAPAVVNIYTRKTVQVQASPLFNDPFFRRFFGNPENFGMPRERVQGSLGSGVIVSDYGLVVTNNHVIAGADSIRVVLSDRREFDAEVVLADSKTDLAVLKIDYNEIELLPFLEFTDSDTVEVGDITLAIGNPFGVGQTVTSGIVSAIARTNAGISDFQFFIQTDAAVNPGNSGGALVGLDGRLIGINTAIFSRTGANNGIGFAIPSNMVTQIVNAALTTGVIVRPWTGFQGQNVTTEIAESLGLDRSGGVIVSELYPGGPAEEAGLLPGDIILMVDGKEVIDGPGLHFRIATADPGETLPFSVYRDGEHMDIPVMLTLPPETPPANRTSLEGRHPLQQVTVANLSPRLSEELGTNILDSGVIVLEVDPRSPAGRRNFIRPGDIILSFNGTPVDLVADLLDALEEPSEDYIYELRRRGQVIECGILGGRSFYCREG